MILDIVSVRNSQLQTKPEYNILQVGSPLEEYLSQNVVNPLSLTLARGSPHFTNYKPDFKDVIDYVLCDSESTVRKYLFQNTFIFLLIK